MPKEIKSFPAFIQETKEDGDIGLVSAYVSVMGNIDHGWDVIEFGAFKKTISERFSKIRVLDNHNLYSAEDAIAKLLTIEEVGRDRLPLELANQYPDATGGLFVQFQFMLDEPTDKSARIFRRIKAGVIDEYSIGFQIIKAVYRDVETDAGKQSIRFITEVKLFEFSPVIFAMNDATTTVSAKNDDPKTQQKASVSACQTCKQFAKVTDEKGYCKQHDIPVDTLYLCDDYIEKKVIQTVGSVFKTELSTFMNKHTESLFKEGLFTDDEMNSIKELYPVVIDTIMNLMPSEIFGREIPEPEIMTTPKSKEVEAESGKSVPLTSDNKTTEKIQSDISRRISEIKAQKIRNSRATQLTN